MIKVNSAVLDKQNVCDNSCLRSRISILQIHIQNRHFTNACHLSRPVEVNTTLHNTSRSYRPFWTPHGRLPAVPRCAYAAASLARCRRSAVDLSPCWCSTVRESARDLWFPVGAATRSPDASTVPRLWPSSVELCSWFETASRSPF